MTIDAKTLYTAQQVRELDRRAIEDHGIAADRLMERAGTAAFRLLRLRWPEARCIAIFCGRGNNGGDGLVVARLAQAAGLEVRLGLKGDPHALQGAAASAWAAWTAAGGQAVALERIDPGAADVIVDALLGTGLDRPVRGELATTIAGVNASGRPVLALDVPSGLQADRGAIMGDAIFAAATVTFIGAKRGLYTGAGPDRTGPVFVDDLGVPAGVYTDVGTVVTRLDRAVVTRALPQRRPCAHKGDHGHMLVIGGDHGFAGAARLAAEAALYAGAGLVTVATRGDHVSGLLAARPELMVRGVEDPATGLPPLLAAVDAVVAGPGLGRGDWGRAALTALVQAEPVRVLLDADALNLLAGETDLRPRASVITPHPGEAARLLGLNTADVQADRFDALQALVARFDATVLLKGAGSLVGDPAGAVTLVAGAQPVLATGGSGDVLGGLIGSLLAQGLTPASAATVGAWLHLAAADRPVAVGDRRRRLPGDLAPAVAAIMRSLSESATNDGWTNDG